MNFANCADFILPATAFDDCNPTVKSSEIERIFIGGPKAAAFTNINSEAEWNSRISQNSLTANTIRAINVIGDLPAAAPVVIEISNGRQKQVGKDFTVNFTVDDLSDTTYNFFKEMDGQTLVRLFGFETYGGKMYHYGNAGKIVRLVSNPVLARGRDAVANEVGTITWRSKVRPNIMDSPIFEGEDDAAPVTTFNSLLTFAASVSDNEDGVAGTVGVADADQSFAFNEIIPQVGTPMSMEIKVGGVSEIVIDYTSDYNGSAFRYNDKAGVSHLGTFTNGIVNY